MQLLQCVARSSAKIFLAVAIAVATSAATGQTPSSSPPTPFIRISGFAPGSPDGGCSAPSANLIVVADGNARHSDNFTMSVNSALVYTWTGETMAWLVASAAPVTYSINGATGTFPANATVTGKITTYDGVNATAANPTTGQRAVYESEISWNCTTGAQVGAIVNRDLRTPRDVPSVSTLGLFFLLLAITGIGLHSRRCTSLGKRTTV
jgi:hypothetical protein